jgi:hypothetical protein
LKFTILRPTQKKLGKKSTNPTKPRCKKHARQSDKQGGATRVKKLSKNATTR